jgi:hypothetical protein
MGLDMFLYRVPKGADARAHIDAEWDKERPKMEWEDLKALRKETYEPAYWRKANQIHAWFVDNVQDGVDNCQYSRPVTKAELESLKALCAEVLANPQTANKRLAPRRGFFFGGYDIDEWYLGELKNTVEQIDHVLNTTNFEKHDIVYHSSW